MRTLTLLCAASLVTACASSPKNSNAIAMSAPDLATSTVPSEGLPPQRLEPGQCGLFLWGMPAPRKFVFFTDGNGSATVLIHDAPVALPMASAGGDVFGQFMTEMTFSDSGAGRSVTLSIKPGEVLEGGQRVASGTLQFRESEGWETILPVTGVRTCLPG